MKVGDVIRHDGLKYTITCFYAPYMKDGRERLKVVDSLKDLLGYNLIKVTAVREFEGYKRYIHIPIENVTLQRDYIPSFNKLCERLPFIKECYEESEQASYDGQHAEEEIKWRDSDLVPNPK